MKVETILCDHCGATIQEGTGYYLRARSYNFPKQEKEFDICSDCRAAFEEFLGYNATP